MRRRSQLRRATARQSTSGVKPCSGEARPSAPLIRLPVDPSPENGLRAPSFVMVDKAMSIRADRLGPPIGRLATADMTRVNRALALFLGIVS